MVAASVTPTVVTDARLLDRWTRVGVAVAVAPLLPWGTVHVFLMSVACHIPWWVAWIPALSTTGVMIASTRLAMRHRLDAHTRAMARWLSWFAITLDALVSGVYHVLPAHINPGPVVVFFVAILPVVMGGCLWHIRSATEAQEIRTASDAAERAAAAHAAQVERDTARAAELAHERQLTQARTAAAAAVQREQAARNRVTTALAAPSKPTLVPATPTGPTDALGREARPSPKRDAALRYLIERCRAGELDAVTGADVDREIGANGYARGTRLANWKRDVADYVAREAA